ncbi:hypothetical protein HUJ04_003148 [Dendroctonus ponderosae]|nr:hypothetical protein HUJ04_003148 [Dendroctonus ponderosae]
MESMTTERRTGNPRRSWGGGINKAMIERNLTVADCHISAQCRKSLECIDQLSFLTNNAFVHLIMDNRGQAKGITATRGHNPKCAATSRHTFCANINDYP